MNLLGPSPKPHRNKGFYMSSPDPRCLPVLVGVGEITDQPQQLERGLEPQDRKSVV